MKKYWPLILLLSSIKLAIHLVGNQNYGFHRDELLHLSVSEHLAWGYFEFPPLIALLGKVSYWLFDYALWGVRLFPTLAGVGILVLCCLMAIELGGKKYAVLLAGISVLAFFPFYRNHTLFQPVAFDQLFWVSGYYLLIKFINSNNKNYLLMLGVVAGIGLMTKYTMAVWIVSFGVGLVFYKRGALYKSWWLYLAGLIALIIFLPNIIWQAQHNFPFLMHMQVLKEKHLDNFSPRNFGLAQLSFPFTLVVSLFGLWAFMLDSGLKKYRSLGVAVITAFALMWVLQAKAYYIFAVYPVIFAAGAVKIEQLLTRKPGFNYLVAATLFIPAIFVIPQMTPVLPIEQFVKYKDLPETGGRVKLSDDYADMFGWQEQVALVDSVYQSLSTKERANCVLWAENYGEAGALKILGKKYGLPDPISRHGSYWSWGYNNKDADVWISLGNEKESLAHVFAEVTLVKIITHKYAIEEENNIPLYICRRPKIDIDQWWRDYENKVFD